MEKVYVPFTSADTPDWLRSLGDISGHSVSWVQSANLPPVVVGDRCLNQSQVRGLLAVLQFAEVPPKALRQHADPASLDVFACRLFEQWLAQGAPAKEKWSMSILATIGGDVCALKLAPLIRAWPGEGLHQRAATGLDCLCSIGSDTALMQLNGIAQKVKSKAVQNKAREHMAAIAKARGLTAEELEDRIVPDLDLDEKGGRTFDYGPRQFRMALDGDLKPMILDDSGKVRADLPKASAQDDPAKAEAAIGAWKLLKKQIREVVKVSVERLEQAMIAGRRWPARDFVDLIVRHPLMTNLARRFVWGRFVEQGKRTGAFRVNEERNLVDVENAPVSLEEKERIGLIHPLHLESEEKARWSAVFSDSQSKPPFPQLGRPIHALEPGEDQGNAITRYRDVSIPTFSLVGTLEGLGWTHGVTDDHGVYSNFSKQFRHANVTAVIALDRERGVAISSPTVWPDQKLACCLFVSGLQPPFRDVGILDGVVQGATPLPLAQVDPVVMSEVLGVLAVLASKSA